MWVECCDNNNNNNNNEQQPSNNSILEVRDRSKRNKCINVA